jgi:hypothetical protein
MCYLSKKDEYIKINGFYSPSTKPFEEENTMLLRNPFDDADYHIPTYISK